MDTAGTPNHHLEANGVLFDSRVHGGTRTPPHPEIPRERLVQPEMHRDRPLVTYNGCFGDLMTAHYSSDNPRVRTVGTQTPPVIRQDINEREVREVEEVIAYMDSILLY